MTQEIWKDVIGCEGMYRISNLGRAMSAYYKGRETILTPINMGGYLTYHFSLNGKKWHSMIHRLIAIHFIPNLENKPQVNHINGIKTDNRIENLEWCTHSENMSHAIRIGIKKYKSGLQHHNNKAVLQYDLNLNLINRFYSAKHAQETTGINRKGISHCCLNKQKTSYGFIWRFENGN